MRRVAVGLLVLAACGDDGDAPPRVTAPPPTLVSPVDAAMPDGGVTVITGFDPRSGMHLDDDDDGLPTRTPGASRNRRSLEIILRSSPSGATALVDGQVVGKTPSFWEGEFTGREREFTFVLPGHALARYKFVPIANGIVHAKLVPVLSDSGALLPILPPLVAAPQPPVKRPPPVDARETDDDAATEETEPPLDAGPATTTTRPDADDGGRSGNGPTP
jgi:hypothetical protein